MSVYLYSAPETKGAFFPFLVVRPLGQWGLAHHSLSTCKENNNNNKRTKKKERKEHKYRKRPGAVMFQILPAVTCPYSPRPSNIQCFAVFIYSPGKLIIGKNLSKTGGKCELELCLFGDICVQVNCKPDQQWNRQEIGLQLNIGTHLLSLNVPRIVIY